MISVIRAELRMLVRRRFLLAALLAAAAFAAIASTAVFLAAQPAGQGTTLDDLARSGGGTQAFAGTTAIAGMLVFAVFIAVITTEFSRGTIRTMLLRQPGRVRLIAGKMTALVMVMAAVLAVTETLTFAASTIIAPIQGVPTAGWFTMTSLGEAAGDYATALLAAGSWAMLGIALAVVVRSTPIALGIGIAWAGPFEHLVQESWSTASSWFPGLLIEAIAVGGTADITLQRASLLTLTYITIAAGTALTLFSRRDITS